MDLNVTKKFEIVVNGYMIELLYESLNMVIYIVPEDLAINYIIEKELLYKIFVLFYFCPDAHGLTI